MSAVATSLISGASDVTAAWLRQRGTVTREKREEHESHSGGPSPASHVINFYTRVLVIEVGERDDGEGQIHASR
jgi:hypothetical protein